MLQEPSSFERARTQSPTPRDTSPPAVPTTRGRRYAAEEISVSTDNAPPIPKTQPPTINEIPPSPKTSVAQPYSYSTNKITEVRR
ncbi:hypothetical protein OESDEN_21277 [Oesophagostomum dentatum]|uniref:Uncharacterized protein n=1 Tax=Oesophagostomum dentatum TaxID=61180 RepID=A0A0B1S5D6_OESDE|nr:hypothetical protein OESDEN_21277 [Oesophagostomum dentatum]